MVVGSFIWFILMWVVYMMADSRKRDCFGWLLFGFIFQPPAAIVLLLLLGHHPDAHRRW